MPREIHYTDWASLSPLTEAIEEARKPVVIALDGFAASGKTTLSARFAKSMARG